MRTGRPILTVAELFDTQTRQGVSRTHCIQRVVGRSQVAVQYRVQVALREHLSIQYSTAVVVVVAAAADDDDNDVNLSHANENNKGIN